MLWCCLGMFVYFEPLMMITWGYLSSQHHHVVGKVVWVSPGPKPHWLWVQKRASASLGHLVSMREAVVFWNRTAFSDAPWQNNDQNACLGFTAVRLTPLAWHKRSVRVACLLSHLKHLQPLAFLMPASIWKSSLDLEFILHNDFLTELHLLLCCTPGRL